MKPVAQEEACGCAVACVAALTGKTYAQSLTLFSIKTADAPILYCKKIVRAVARAGLKYDYAKVTAKNKKLLSKEGTIVFIKRSKKYPVGHYLLRVKDGWMDAWINLPKVNPAKAGVRKKLPGKAQWVVYGKSKRQR